jgi:thiol-activated cytolysin
MKNCFLVITACLISFFSFSQIFQDNVSNETIGDFPSQWDIVTGMANVDQIEGYSVISIMHGGKIKPVVNGLDDNYLKGEFILEFDAFFDRASSLFGQRFEIRLWAGTSVYYKDGISYSPFILTRHGIKTSWSSPEPGNSATYKKELETLEPVWRHIKVECLEEKLKIYLDEQLILQFPRFKMQPTMISIGAMINESQYNNTKLGITNITLAQIGGNISQQSNSSRNDNDDYNTNTSPYNAGGNNPDTTSQQSSDTVSGSNTNPTQQSGGISRPGSNLPLGSPGFNNNSDNIEQVEIDGFNTTDRDDISEAISNNERKQPFQKIETGSVYSNTGGYSPKGYRILQAKNSFSEYNNTDEYVKLSEPEGEYICVTKDLTLSANSDNYSEFVLNSSQDWMKPGVFINASKYIQDNPVILDYKRHPVNLLITTPNTSYSQVQVINPEQKGNLQTAISQLIMAPGNTVAMDASYYAYEVHSEQELNFKLYGRYKGANVSASLGLDFSQQKESHYYVLEVTQKMFDIEVDNFGMYNTFIDDTGINYSDIIYVSSVSYGRKAIVVIETNFDMKSFNTDLQGSLNTLVHKAKLETSLDYVKRNSSFKMKAVLYGGSTEAGFKDLIKSNEEQRIELSNYLLESSDNPQLAKPISYKLKNLAGESVGLGSSFKQSIRTCRPPFSESIKLKVTLTDLLCIKKRDNGDNPDDYAFQQSIEYISNNTQKVGIDNQSRGNYPISGCNWILPYSKNKLACGDMNQQLHLPQTGIKESNVMNHVIFEIKPEEVSDASATFKIHSWLKEYTSGNDLILYDEYIDVQINEVLADLVAGAENSDAFDKPFFDPEIMKANYGQFNSYNSGPHQKLWLRQVGNTLEGPISLGRTTKNEGYRGAAWIKFEIVN